MSDGPPIRYTDLATITVLGDERYFPAEIDLDNLAIGVGEDTLSNLNLNPEHLIVGERRVLDTDGAIHKSYGLIVDAHGVSINTPIPDRVTGNQANTYALQVEGSVYISGSLHASNLRLDMALQDDILALASSAASNPWRFVSCNVNSAFFDGNVTVGNENYASLSPHPISIVEPGNRAVQTSQFAIANTQMAKLNVGILGNAINSPVVFHSSNSPIEFHVGRPNSYYTQMYTELFTDADGLQTRPADVPRYGTLPNAPHMSIDLRGNVGIHTNETPFITYNRREKPSLAYDPILVPHSDYMALSVHGPLYASNVLIYDPDTNSPLDINQLFARINGTFLPANQILPGSFARGDFAFPGSLSIATPNERTSGYSFAVASNAHFRDNVLMDKNLQTSNIDTDFAYVARAGTFGNTLSVLGQSDFYDNLVVHGGISIAEPGGAGGVSYQNVQFTFFSETLSNINYFGNGITTPGKLGVGVSPYVADDIPNNMLAIRNRDPLPKTYELELMDLRNPNMRKVAFLGHTHTSSNYQYDASFVIATPSSNDPRYHATDTTLPVQNIYMYPGADLNTEHPPLIRQDHPPVLGAFAPQQVWDRKGRVGINTFSPQAMLHVAGTLAFSSNLFQIDPETGDVTTLGIWKREEFENTNASAGQAPQFTGIQYLDPSAAHVGINTLPLPDYGVVVAGGIKSLDGYYTQSGQLIMPWVRPDDSLLSFVNLGQPYYAQGPIGIGVTSPSNVLEIKNRLAGPTWVHLISSETDTRTGFRISGGTQAAHSWFMQGESADNSFELYATPNVGIAPEVGNVGIGSTTRRALQVVRDTARNTYQTFINRTSNLDITALGPIVDPSAALTVNGALNVLGNVYATGSYYASGIVLATSAVSNPSLSNLVTGNNDDVFIAGNDIHLLPQNGGSVTVGIDVLKYTNIKTDSLSAGIPMRIHNQSTATQASPVGLSMSTAKAQCFLEFQSTTRRLWLGLDDDKFAVYAVNNTTGATQRRFLTFNDLNGAEAMGINETAPKALLHVTNTSSNQIRATRTSQTATSLAVPTIQLETLTTAQSPNVARMWSFAGPDLATNDKLGLFYSTNSAVAGLGSELFTFSKNGGIGIGNTNPSYAIDIKNTESFGGIRLWNTDTNAQPQIIFQAGPSEDFGGDSATDFRMLTFANTFQFNAQTSGSGSRQIMRANSVGQVGFGTDPFTTNATIRLNVRGGINVTDTFYVNGSPLFDSQDSDSFILRSKNIILNPTASASGSLLVNAAGTTGTSNLFQVFVNAANPEDPNDAAVSRAIVFDGRGDEVQVTFRTHDTETANVTAYTYRQWQHHRLFGLEFMDPAPLDQFIGSGHEGWSNVVTWEPLLSPTIRNQFTMRNFGDVELLAPTPSITFGDNANTAALIGQQNGNAYIETPNVGLGLGTRTPGAALHVVNTAANATVPALFVQNAGTSGMAAEIDGAVATSRGTQAAPALAYRNDLGTGWWSPSQGAVALSASGQETLRATALGDLGLGTSVPSAHFHLHTSNNSTSLRIDYDTQTESGTPFIDIFSSNTVVFRATNDGKVGFGTSPTVDFQVARPFNFIDEGQFSSNVLFSCNIFVVGDVRHQGVVTHDSDLRLKSDLVRIEGALDKVQALTGFTYNVTATGKRATGLVAQDVLAVLPEAVEENQSTGTLGVAYGNMMGLVVEAIKELREELVNLRYKVGC